jgi:hypothetical protein
VEENDLVLEGDPMRTLYQLRIINDRLFNASGTEWRRAFIRVKGQFARLVEFIRRLDLADDFVCVRSLPVLLSILLFAFATVRDAADGAGADAGGDDGAALGRNLSQPSVAVLRAVLLADGAGVEVLRWVGAMMHKAFELFASSPDEGALGTAVLQGLQVVKLLLSGHVEADRLSLHILAPAVGLLVCEQLAAGGSELVRGSIATHLFELAGLDATAAGVVLSALGEALPPTGSAAAGTYFGLLRRLVQAGPDPEQARALTAALAAKVLDPDWASQDDDVLLHTLELLAALFEHGSAGSEVATPRAVGSLSSFFAPLYISFVILHARQSEWA